MCNKTHRQFLNNPPDFSFYLYPVTREEVTKYIKTLKPNTASGYDEIPSKLLQATCPHNQFPPLTVVIGRAGGGHTFHLWLWRKIGEKD
ncbi:hypothetical protein SK128_012802 [Halocaridina rubra]|uniref:Uncharacterized protein n=1 Tax=Halocaridina rubra TaxID=373956 RepID=A0AAN8XD38_HALRR